MCLRLPSQYSQKEFVLFYNKIISLNYYWLSSCGPTINVFDCTNRAGDRLGRRRACHWPKHAGELVICATE